MSLTPTGDVNAKLNEARMAALGRIEELEAQLVVKDRLLAAARKPRNRVTLIGGPRDGDIQLFDTQSAPYLMLLRATSLRSSVYTTYDGAPDVQTVTDYYRIQRLNTGEGDRFIGVFERTV